MRGEEREAVLRAIGEYADDFEVRLMLAVEIERMYVKVLREKYRMSPWAVRAVPRPEPDLYDVTVILTGLTVNAVFDVVHIDRNTCDVGIRRSLSDVGIFPPVGKILYLPNGGSMNITWNLSVTNG